jgi:hypothetical protein
MTWFTILPTSFSDFQMSTFSLKEARSLVPAVTTYDVVSSAGGGGGNTTTRCGKSIDSYVMSGILQVELDALVVHVRDVGREIFHGLHDFLGRLLDFLRGDVSILAPGVAGSSEMRLPWTARTGHLPRLLSG